MSYQSILCIYYPQQLLPALVALRHYRQLRHQQLEQPTLIYVRITANNTQGQALADAIQKLVRHIEWVTVVITFPKSWGMISEYHLPVKWRAFSLRRHYRVHAIQEIFYVHDVTSDFIAQTWMQAFPKATRICFGDSLGIVYSQKYFTQLIYATEGTTHRFTIQLKSWLKKARRRFVLPRTPLNAHRAILMIPSDPGGDFLINIPLDIPSRANIQSVLTLLEANTPNELQHIKRTPDIEKNKKNTLVFFILSNLNEAKLTTLNNEIRLYQDIIDTHAPKNAQLLIKAHPGSNAHTLTALKTQLTHPGGIDYIPQAHAVYPVELNKTLLFETEKILSISYSSVSIPYLYGIEVVHALDATLIDKYFKDESKKWMQEGNEQYLQMREASL